VEPAGREETVKSLLVAVAAAAALAFWSNGARSDVTVDAASLVASSVVVGQTID
jgi:hypothetical protein